MSFYRSKYKGSQFERAVSVTLRNRGKGSQDTPVYLERDGIAVKVQDTEVPSLEGKSLVTSNGMKEFLDVKLSKDEIDIELGSSNTTVSSQKAIKTYYNENLSTKQNINFSGKGIDLDKDLNVVSLSEDIYKIKDRRLNEEVDWFTSIKSGNDSEIVKELKKAIKNKTKKIETIRDKNFEVEGSPSVTEDCIVDDFTEGLIVIPYTLKTSKNYTIEGSFTLGEDLGEQTILSITKGQDSTGLHLHVTEDGLILDYYNSRAAGGHVNWSQEELPLESGKKYWYEISIEGTHSYCRIEDTEKQTKDLNHFGSTGIKLGQDFKGIIDLNDFKISEGNMIRFQPSLKIPYYISNNGKRVVEEAYLKRVLEAYNQLGYSTYFVLVGKEYVLPTAEVHDLVKTFYSGCSGYSVRADHTVLQQGQAVEDEKVTFLISFKDDSYSLTIPYKSKDSKGFIPAVTGDWIAKGNALLY